RLARVLQQVLERAGILPGAAQIVALDRAPVLVADVEQLLLLLAQHRRLPHLSREREAQAHEGDGEEDRKVGEAALIDGDTHRHQSPNDEPSLALPCAPLLTS